VEGGHLPLVRGITHLVMHSLSCARHVRDAAVSLLARVAGFEMWRFPRLPLAWLLLTDAAVLGWTTWEATQTVLTWSAAIDFAALAACATAHVVATRVSEEVSFGAQPRNHIDQTSIWIFTGGMVLPAPLLLLLVTVVRVQRYRIARKPAFRFIFSSAGILASALGVHTVAGLMNLHPWLAGERSLLHQLDSDTVHVVAGLMTAVAVYFIIQAALIGVAYGLTDTAQARASAGRAPSGSSAPVVGPEPVWNLKNLLGSWQNNQVILYTLAVAVLATIALAQNVVLLAVSVPIAVRFTRTEQKIEHTEKKLDHAETNAENDDLTGLLNRRAFNVAAELELLVGTKTGRSTGVLWLDIDHFKAWNDELGHLGGDQVLKALAAVMRAQVRTGDLICRRGGEEFVIVLPNASVDETMAIAERIRVTFASLKLTVRKPAGGREVTIDRRFRVSIGVALAPLHGTELDELNEAADQALMYCKANGRNQVAVAAGPADEQAIEPIAVA
jgi:diguanylate cyclase (GGDEF)-like protein